MAGHASTWESRLAREDTDPGLHLDTLFPTAVKKPATSAPSLHHRARPTSAGPQAGSCSFATANKFGEPGRLADRRVGGQAGTAAGSAANKRLSVAQKMADAQRRNSRAAQKETLLKDLDAKSLAPKPENPYSVLDDESEAAGSDFSVQMDNLHYPVTPQALKDMSHREMLLELEARALKLDVALTEENAQVVREGLKNDHALGLERCEMLMDELCNLRAKARSPRRQPPRRSPPRRTSWWPPSGAATTRAPKPRTGGGACGRRRAARSSGPPGTSGTSSRRPRAGRR